MSKDVKDILMYVSSTDLRQELIRRKKELGPLHVENIKDSIKCLLELGFDVEDYETDEPIIDVVIVGNSVLFKR